MTKTISLDRALQAQSNGTIGNFDQSTIHFYLSYHILRINIYSWTIHLELQNGERIKTTLKRFFNLGVDDIFGPLFI